MNAFWRVFIRARAAGAESFTDVDIFFHPRVKMSSISFYSSFVTSLLSGRFRRLPSLVSLKRAAVTQPPIIPPFSLASRGSRGLGPLCAEQQVAEAGRVIPQTLLCSNPPPPATQLRVCKRSGAAKPLYLGFCWLLESRGSVLKSSLEKPLSPGRTAALPSIPGTGGKETPPDEYRSSVSKTASGQNFPRREIGRDEFNLQSPKYRGKYFLINL